MPNKKIMYGGTSFIEKMEEAAGISGEEAQPEQVQKQGIQVPAVPSGKGFVPPAYTGPKPWQKKESEKLSGLQKRAVTGSGAFTDSEIKKGYRKVS